MGPDLEEGLIVFLFIVGIPHGNTAQRIAFASAQDTEESRVIPLGVPGFTRHAIQRHPVASPDILHSELVGILIGRILHGEQFEDEIGALVDGSKGKGRKRFFFRCEGDLIPLLFHRAKLHCSALTAIQSVGLLDERYRERRLIYVIRVQLQRPLLVVDGRQRTIITCHGKGKLLVAKRHLTVQRYQLLCRLLT